MYSVAIAKITVSNRQVFNGFFPIFNGVGFKQLLFLIMSIVCFDFARSLYFIPEWLLTKYNDLFFFEDWALCKKNYFSSRYIPPLFQN